MSSDDIVQRLRDHPHTMVDRCECVRCEAADRIATLTRTLATLAAECDEQGALVTAWRGVAEGLYGCLDTDPVDRTHADSVAAVAAIRAEVARLRQGVAVWVPRGWR